MKIRLSSVRSRCLAVTPLLAGVALLFGACAAPVTTSAPPATVAQVTPAPASTAMPATATGTSPAASAVLAGTYRASGPAADAPGMTRTLELTPDKSAHLTTEYQGKPGSLVASGSWSPADDQHVTVVLRDTNGRAVTDTITFELRGDALVATAYDKALYGSDGLDLQRATIPVTQPAAGVSEEALRNAEYRLPDIGSFRLQDGKFEYSYGSGATQVNRVGFSQAARGDLNGDGREDAAVALWANTGGSGTFVYIVAVLDGDGQSRQAAADMLGDRVQVQKLTVAGGQVVVDVNSFAPSDPMCCPSSRVTRTYRLEGTALKVASEVKATPAPGAAPAASATPVRGATPVSGTAVAAPATRVSTAVSAGSAVPASDLASLRYDPATWRCQNEPAERVIGPWQTTAGGGRPINAKTPMTLELRRKFGEESGQYRAQAQVIAPDGQIATAQTTGKAAEWAQLSYPADFVSAPATQPGIYTVVWQVEGKFATCTGFEVVQ